MGASGSICDKKIYYLSSEKDKSYDFLALLNNYVSSISHLLVSEIKECNIIILSISENMLSDYNQCNAIHYAEENNVPILFICLDENFNPQSHNALKKVMKNYSCCYTEGDLNLTIKKINSYISSFNL